MPVEISYPAGEAVRFLLAASRIAAVFAFGAFPGVRSTSAAPKIVAALVLALSLYPVWPPLPETRLTAGRVAAWMLGEAAIGVVAGLAVAVLLEAMVMAAQIYGLQAGYGYASTVDPSSEADSATLQVLSHLIGQLLFFALGFHRQMILWFAESYRRLPPGSFPPLAASETVIHWGAAMMECAVRLALPVVVLLLLSDVTLACLGRLNQQLQLLTLTFPVKMLACLLVLGVLAPGLPRLYGALGRKILAGLPALWGP